jgi:4-hydroxybenzoate polyprenyltransferase
MLARIRVILEMIKFSHTVFALPFALLAACLASERAGGWTLLDFIGILVCMVFARSAAMGFNRWADRDIDAGNPRTSNRAIPAGKVSERYVLAFVAVCSIGFVAGSGVFWISRQNLWPLVLSVPVLGFLFGYSYAKRFTDLSHLWLGTALALAPPAAWLAIRGAIELPPMLIGVAVICWVTGFDIIYACQDIDVDRRLGLRSIPARLGMAGALWVSRGAHVGMLVSLAALGLATPELGIGYGIGVVFVGGLLAVEHWLVRGRDLFRINVAFLHVNGVISTALLVVTLVDLYWPIT